VRFSKTEISHTTGADPNSEADKSLTLTGQKMEMGSEGEVNHFIFNMLNSFSINPKYDCYQQRRSKYYNNYEPIFFLHVITGDAILLKAKLPAYREEIQIRRLTKI